MSAVAELIAMLEAADREEGSTIFNHTPEEFGLHVMENHEAILAALRTPPAPVCLVLDCTNEAIRAEIAAMTGPGTLTEAVNP